MNDFGSESYKPSDAELFMNERQREYFRRKLIAWRESILAESRDTLNALNTRARTIPTSPTARRRRPTARSSCAPATVSAS